MPQRPWRHTVLMSGTPARSTEPGQAGFARVPGFRQTTAYPAPEGWRPADQPSIDRRQLRDRQRQPLHSMPPEVDLRARIGAAALERDDDALAELGMKNPLPRP